MTAEPAIDAELARLSDRIGRWREERGLSRRELAQRSGVAVSTVHKVESGQMVPSVAVVLKLAHGLGRRPSEILAESEARPETRIDEVRAWRIALGPGASTGGPATLRGQVLVVCERGRVVVETDVGVRYLDGGEVTHVRANRPFVCRNAGEAPADMVLTGSVTRPG